MRNQGHVLRQAIALCVASGPLLALWWRRRASADRGPLDRRAHPTDRARFHHLAWVADDAALIQPRLGRHLRAISHRYLNPLVVCCAGRRWSPFALVWHTGRRSGRIYATPLLALSAPGTVVIPLTYGFEADWVQNLLAADRCVVVRRGQRLRADQPRVRTAAQTLPWLAWPWSGVLRVSGMRSFVWLRVTDD